MFFYPLTLGHWSLPEASAFQSVPAFLGRQADQGADLRGGGTWAGRSAGSPAVGQVLRRRLAFFVAPLVTGFLPTVLR